MDLCLKDDPFFESANSRLSSLKNTPSFAKMGMSIRFDREGAFYQSVYKAHVKITFNSLSALFVLSLCRRCQRIDEASWAILLRTLYWYFHVCGNHEGHKYN